MEIQEIATRVKCVRLSLNHAFDNGSIDIDHIVKELETLEGALACIGERLNKIDEIRAPLKSRLQNKSNQTVQMDVCVVDYH